MGLRIPVSILLYVTFDASDVARVLVVFTIIEDEELLSPLLSLILGPGIESPNKVVRVLEDFDKVFFWE